MSFIRAYEVFQCVVPYIFLYFAYRRRWLKKKSKSQLRKEAKKSKLLAIAGCDLSAFTAWKCRNWLKSSVTSYAGEFIEVSSLFIFFQFFLFHTSLYLHWIYCGLLARLLLQQFLDSEIINTMYICYALMLLSLFSYRSSNRKSISNGKDKFEKDSDDSIKKVIRVRKFKDSYRGNFRVLVV